MANALAFIGGGLLEGAGRGLAEDGKAKRKAALLALEQENRLALEDKRQEGRRGLLTDRIAADDARAGRSDEAAIERLGLNIKSREGVAEGADKSRADIAAAGQKAANKRAADANANRTGLAKIRETGADKRNKANINKPAPGFRDTADGNREFIPGGSADPVVQRRQRAATNKPTDTTAAEKRIIESHTTTDENGNPSVDHEAAAADMVGRGMKAGARAQRAMAKGIADVDLQQRAEVFADARVDEESGFLTSDSSAFKDDGGSRVRFRARMVREFKANERGRGAPSAAAPGRAQAQAEPYTGDKPPPGVAGARRAKDGFWYIEQNGKFQRVMKGAAGR